MAKVQVAEYLNDHLAGSVIGLEILAFLQRRVAGTHLEQIVGRLATEVAMDRKELERLMDELHVPVSRTRKAVAWIGEKFSELKLRTDDSEPAFQLLEALDALSMGMEGKALLWKALAAAAEGAESLRCLDYEHLIRRAEEQREQVEAMRMESARAALGGS